MSVSPADRADLLAKTAELVAIPSVSHHETALADHVEAALRKAPWLETVRIGDNLVARSSLGRRTRLVLAGHLDTVPPNGNEIPRIQGDSLSGLGSADMKSGLAVFMTLASALPDPAHDVTFVFYVCEEVARHHSGLLQIEAVDPSLLKADAAILGEPTGARVEAGCQGSLRVMITLGGERAHTARPWIGTNAIHRAAPLLQRLAAYEARRPVIDGCEYREATQAVSIEGGVAGNVVPDQAHVVVNHRFAPDRTAEEAFVHLSDWLWPALDRDIDVLLLEDSSPAAAPSLSQPLLQAVVEASGRPPRAKLGWTDVAFFAERGIPAANFGPGDPEVAHSAGEHVTRRDLEVVYRTLATLLSS